MSAWYMNWLFFYTIEHIVVDSLATASQEAPYVRDECLVYRPARLTAETSYC